MTNKKISALPAAATPLAGNELIPMSNGTNTVYSSVYNLTAGRPVNTSELLSSGSIFFGQNGNYGAGCFYSDANWGLITRAKQASPGIADFAWMDAGGTKLFSIVSSNLVPAVAAKGINFTANTPAAGMTSRLLNWYEEGTWTPQLSTATPPTTPFTMGSNNATYTRIGRQVTVRANVSTANVDLTGASGAVFISGLPFTVASSGWAAGAVAIASNWAANHPSECEAESGTDRIYLFYRTTANGGSSVNQSTDITSGAVSFGNTIFVTVTYFV